MSTTAEPVALGVSSPVADVVAKTTTTVANAIAKTVAVISSTVSTSSTTGTTSTATATATSTSPTSATPTTSTTFAYTPTPTPIQSASASLEDGGEKLSVKDLGQALQHFGIVDYLVFIAMLAVCAVIGFYFGFIEKKQKKQKLAGKDGGGGAGIEERRGSEALDYLVGGRQMKVFPVALSLVASFVSGISLLGTSTEIYVYGTQYAFILVTLAISGAISWYIFLPVFCNLQLTSTYEYFEMRFNKSVRLLGSAFFTGVNLIWLPIVIYVPALAFNQVTGINIHVITPIVCLVCIFYTAAGGLKAVVWTDVIQTVIMVGAIFFVIIKGTVDLGGLGVVIQRNFDSGRMEWPELTLDPKVRMSMLAMMVGNIAQSSYNLGCNQIITQRYLSLPGLKQMAQCSFLFISGLVVLMAICLYNGLLLSATYYDCDPLTTKLAVAKDQLVPLLVVQSMSSFPGVPGMFVAGVFSAALSSLSTGMNSLSAVFLEDYIRPLTRKPLTEHQTAVIMRVCTVLIGVMSVALVFVVEQMGSHVMQLSMTVGSVAQGPLLGLFVMGLLCPSINSKSAIVGSLCSFFFMGWLCLSAQLAINSGEMQFESKPVSVEGCDYEFDRDLLTPANATIPMTEAGSLSFAQQLYHISFMFYSVMGAAVGVITAHLAGFVFGRNTADDVDIELLSPCIRRFQKSSYASVKLDENTLKSFNAKT
ncbi:sodium-coupled monocarboxylate transporter 1-like isoform X3 [Drosophila santomea]|uniref:sodium-coupled monocarboxylate transporter 1-like isoform X3 n=1 Tax=Drosophila santomea TaxID=129105 RepID=UPI001953EB93|nr:sodium-coupled monocarboxylate transporter 1-like isoform X3 [Drosophila santomea]